MNNEFFTISSKALEEAEAAQQFKLVVPDTARPDRAGTGHKWTEVVNIESVDAVSEPDQKRMYFEVAVVVAGETFSPGNVGKQLSKRFYVWQDPTDGQKKMMNSNLSRIQELVKACGFESPKEMDQEWIQYYFGFDSPFKGQTVSVSIWQHPRKDDPKKWEYEFSNFLVYP